MLDIVIANKHSKIVKRNFHPEILVVHFSSMVMCKSSFLT